MCLIIIYVILCCVLGLEARFWSQRGHMRTPWPHQLIKAHDSPLGCDKAALNGQVVRWIRTALAPASGAIFGHFPVLECQWPWNYAQE